MTGYCKNCRYSEQAIGTEIYYCRAIPPRPVVFDGAVQWTAPPMRPTGWCGLFRLAFWKWLAGLVSNGPRA